jgi:hypothetical protein
MQLVIRDNVSSDSLMWSSVRVACKVAGNSTHMTAINSKLESKWADPCTHTHTHEFSDILIYIYTYVYQSELVGSRYANRQQTRGAQFHIHNQDRILAENDAPEAWQCRDVGHGSRERERHHHINDNFHKTTRQREGKEEEIIEHANDNYHVVTLMVNLVGH